MEIRLKKILKKKLFINLWMHIITYYMPERELRPMPYLELTPSSLPRRNGILLRNHKP
jgi:hypothetical protein